MLVGFQRVVSFTSALIGKALIGIGDLISYLTISEKYWDASSEEYAIRPPVIDTEILEQLTAIQSKSIIDDKSIVSKIIQLIHQLINNYNEYVKELIKENELILEIISQKIAYICGIWNGLIDFVAGTLRFFGEHAQLLNKSSEEREVIYEQLDNFIELLSEPNLFDKLKQNYDIFINELKAQLFDKNNELNLVRIHYMAGFTVTFIASLFIPIADLAALEKLGKVGKTITELLQSLGAKVTQEANALGQMVKNNSNALLKASQDVLSLIAKGGNDLIDFIKSLAKKLADWFLKNKEKVYLADEIEAFLKTLIITLKKNPKYLDSIAYIKSIGRPLGSFLVIEQEAAINLYTKSYYIIFNRALRKIEGKMTVEFKAMQKVLDNALEKLPVFNQGNKPLLRSAKFSEELIKKLFKQGKDFTDAGFFSTTYSENALLRWMKNNPTDNVLFKVYGKNGKLIEKSSDVIPEAEVLFKSNTTFFVENVEKYYNRKLMREVTEIILKEK